MRSARQETELVDGIVGSGILEGSWVGVPKSPGKAIPGDEFRYPASS